MDYLKKQYMLAENTAVNLLQVSAGITEWIFK